MPKCNECFRGEIDAEAVMKVKHPNDSYPNLRVTQWICEHHLTMLSDDWGDDCVVVEDLRREPVVKRDRFASGRGSTKGGVIVCLVCKRNTRETGMDETSLEMCRFCIRENYAENEYSDGDINKQEYDEWLAEIAKEREAA